MNSDFDDSKAVNIYLEPNEGISW